ncbi:MAG TPA: hypothetical protein ACFYD2_09945 [Candidatus Avalokitesvara rifleensis]|uniref:hypothetical protein n=1 Tax=Candidatus Avalokitesvara rifleensis TaxID=3367620 RepID=UPI0040284DF2
MNRLSEPVGKFRIATEGTIEVAQPYITELNQVERSLRFTEAFAKPDMSVDGEFLSPIFAPEGIRARLDCFAAISLYASRLAEVADSSTGKKLRTNTEALGASLKDLGSRIESITGDKTINSYAGPVSALIGFIGELWVQNERKKALETAIKDAAPLVNKILCLLESDLKMAHQGRTEVLLARYNELRLAYNSNRKKATLGDAERRERLNELERLANQYEQLMSFPPQDVIIEMKRAHEAMVRAAEDLDKIETFRDFVGAVEVFAMRVQQAQAVFSSFRAAH